MLNIIIKAVFFVITKLFSIILSPILTIIIALFPNLAQITTGATDFMTTYIFPYVTFVMQILENLVFLPHWLVVFLFDYFLIKYTIFITIQAVRFGIQVYNKLKP